MLCRAPVGACLRSNLLRKSSPAKAGSIRPVIFENRKYKKPLKTLVAHRASPMAHAHIANRHQSAQASGPGGRRVPRGRGVSAGVTVSGCP